MSGEIGLGWLVRGTVSNLPLLQFYLDLFWAFWLVALLPSTLLGFSSSLGYLPRLCLRPLLLSDTLPSQSICMSQRPSDDGEILDLTCTFQSLRISIRGPSSQASEALSVLTTHFGGTRRSSSPAPTDSSFDLVGATVASSAPVVSGPDTRVSLERGFPACPSTWLQQSSRLSGSNLSGQGRLERAWKAGCWASVVQAGRIGSPNSTPALDLRSRFYAVLSAPGLEQPTIFRSSASYWRVIGSLRNSPAISHSFPSEIEAKVYLAAAGVVDPDIQP